MNISSRTIVDCDPCTTLAAIVTAVDTFDKLGDGHVGNLDSSSLKNLLGNPSGFANYTRVYIMKISDRVLSLYAVGAYANKFATGYIFYDASSWRWNGWKIIY